MTSRLALAFVLLAGPAMAQSLPTAASLAPGSVNYLSPGVQPDLALGAYQRGYFLTALAEAKKRIDINKNDAAAMTLIAQLYKEGSGVRQDPVEAARWFRLAADRGDPEAAFSLAIAYLEGKGVEKSTQKALPLLEAAAAREHPAALYQLGLQALNGDIQNAPRAADLFRRASKAGDYDATYALGLMYKEGRGVAKDSARAAEYLRAAADSRLAAAEVDYAIMLFNGDGVEKNEEGAAKYFLRAANVGNPVAMNRIARMYVAGRGVAMNLVEAMKWHILARSAGERDEFLESQLSRLTPRERASVEEGVRKQVGP